MPDFVTSTLPTEPVATAPDGTAVRILPVLDGGSLAHFVLAPGQTSLAVAHRSVEEIWYFLGGQGEMWRKQYGREEVVPVKAGVSLTVPLGTAFGLWARRRSSFWRRPCRPGPAPRRPM